MESKQRANGKGNFRFKILVMVKAEPVNNTAPIRFEGVRALIFDLDGTLIDSKLDLALSVNATLEHAGRAALPHPRIYGYVGKGAPRLIEQALGSAASSAECEEGLAFFLSYYRNHMLDNTVTYPGVRAGRWRRSKV